MSHQPESEQSNIETIKFGVFEADLHVGELRKKGHRVRLQEKPFQALALLLERPGELITREQFRIRLWPAGTFVEFDDNLNSTIKRVREALGDSADSPRYIETVPRRGYRFILPIERPRTFSEPIERAPRPASLALVVDSASNEPAVSPAEVEPPSLGKEEAVASQARIQKPGRRRKVVVYAVAAILLILVSAGVAWRIGWGRGISGGSIWRINRGPRRTITGSSNRIMLAVLPFKNLSGQPDQEFAADGMTEEMIAQLGRLYPQGLGVIARTSVMRFKSSDADIGQIGRELGVGYVLEGSVRRDADKAFITAQLIQVGDQTHLWAETYERPLRDLFDVQRDVARNVAESLALKLLPEQNTALARADTIDTTAYEDYLRGSYALKQGTRASFESARDSFQDAVRRDPKYAMAYAGLARAYLELGGYHFLSAPDVSAGAGDAISKGIESDSSIPDLYVLRATWLSRQGGSASDVEAAYRRAIELDANSAEAHHEYAVYLMDKNRFDESLAEIDHALELDPLGVSVATHKGWILWSAGKPSEAEAQLRRALDLDPNYPAAMYFLGHVLDDEGRTDEATASFEKALTASGRTPKYLAVLATRYAKSGRMDDARKLLNELRERSKTEYVSPDYLAWAENAVKGSSGQ